jgi:hypothetical protein
MTHQYPTKKLYFQLLTFCEYLSTCLDPPETTDIEYDSFSLSYFGVDKLGSLVPHPATSIYLTYALKKTVTSSPKYFMATLIPNAYLSPHGMFGTLLINKTNRSYTLKLDVGEDGHFNNVLHYYLYSDWGIFISFD